MGLCLSGSKAIFTLVFDVDDFITVTSLSIIMFTEIELRRHVLREISDDLSILICGFKCRCLYLIVCLFCQYDYSPFVQFRSNKILVIMSNKRQILDYDMNFPLNACFFPFDLTLTYLQLFILNSNLQLQN